MIRRIIPKGIEFDDLTQEQANLIASHINSYGRKSIETTPISLAKIYLGEDFFTKTCIREISPKDITLEPKLLR